uniref:G-protein coupled receptors family 1 profile domain-containing protein n=1 Tax=Knipowitschia caucasica TaxID=637954 RepID=A0AAV2KML0_KNICA
MDNSTPPFDNCVSSAASRYLFLSWFIIYLLMLPLFLFVLYIGFNKWKKPQSSASGGLNHSDVFTLNMVTMEIISVVGTCVACYGFMKLNSEITSFGGDTVITTMTGQTLFHSLTCVERYLAVVHPVVYLRLKRGGGVIIKNISIIFVWCCFLVCTVAFGRLSQRLCPLRSDPPKAWRAGRA